MMKLFPEDVAEGIVATLQRVIAARHDLITRAHDVCGKIGVSYQVNDPKNPAILRIDVDAPAPPHSSAKDVYLARLEIDKETGRMRFFRDGYQPLENQFLLEEHPFIVQQIANTIWNN
ncbi:MAG: hypothetical protein UX49_C0007G0009 [Candidatus Wolfebacteria bacterium GW2011_GWC2_46_275]|uniref:Uncharacterized protein n=2 Tax=Candidatus Wolfeibacteriota TaxID=1752735 RepID=A0A0G1U5V6_9BACT|nr:MAG: hypothetical protein UX70_C0001G0611 [Candidatus Wolfebacteria bacterium GW2011_GWB1_47_1]KKU36850.1 MAG: hypothetical protein UX49_C0007G0009 [Candidatus Wolfebacteria bacterium GW2011_GWC2_46_275]KKU42459.1 MAG: hypothetical protein UX58_C0002G0173 [Candidatus Wolfebacteria bacterium GW2011_GWB2_46_69]KKU54244.1 MAG: hypothetical protein UX76_C0004G0048 [Candidatus Wolfebacteria bacterium GW2011_GWC1_47_103]KKU59612.1 MAG: hypothetical protein UX83_C0003G0027 [Candidatus Wolfebacteria